MILLSPQGKRWRKFKTKSTCKFCKDGRESPTMFAAEKRNHVTYGVAHLHCLLQRGWKVA